jgi:hypothetical protein
MSERELEIVKASAKALRDLYQDDFGGVLPWHLLDKMEREYYRAQARVVLAISRHLILEEAAKVAEADNTPAYGSDNQAMEWLAHRQRQNIAAAIRSLSLADKEKGDE